MDDDTDQTGMVEYAWDHGIISDELYKSIKMNCNFSSDAVSPVCDKDLDKFYDSFNYIDIYSIFTPICTSPGWSAKTTRHFPKSFSKLKRLHGQPAAGYDPCVSEYTETYLNRPDVQLALHANVTRLYYPWTHCSFVITDWIEGSPSVLPIIKKLIDGGVRVWVYSGDTDARLPVTSTRLTMNKLGLKTDKIWMPWFTSDQVGGWYLRYEGLTFVTIRGAGHMVPTFAPVRSLQLLHHFLVNQTLSSIPIV
ncbi:hypothetical protein J5N97_023774 [Dioscorea zingiberensis]|uniref:Uncharacterized protein n=1 Tax=Dioscorea zingiberensis TaxID=325984 RepID=A0A9D5H8A7_9LILI|nr:hypothetical protein J5N97_023774 [Dioscorea zingiberensis]